MPTYSYAVRMRNVLDKIVQKIKTHILCSVTPPPENRDVYETVWKRL
jgi:hypothetical protein